VRPTLLIAILIVGASNLLYLVLAMFPGNMTMFTLVGLQMRPAISGFCGIFCERKGTAALTAGRDGPWPDSGAPATNIGSSGSGMRAASVSG
jgi:hypothetical protein